MPHIEPQYLTNPQGARTGVLLSLGDYEAILAELEELEAIRAYDLAKASEDEAIPFD